MVGATAIRGDCARPRTLLAGLAVGVLLLGFGPPPSVSASEYVVTTSYPTGEGSLRWAIQQANDNPGPDTITFDMAGVVVSWMYFDGLCGGADFGELVITEDVTIIGPGSESLSIEQRPYSCDEVFTRIIHINGATEVNISGLKFSYGRTADGEAGADSGHGAAIYNETANLTLTDCIFEDNSTGEGGDSPDGAAGDGGSGGAVYCSAGTLTVTHCKFNYNQAGRGGDSGSEDDSMAGTGAGAGGSGGAICFLGSSLILQNTTFYMNQAGNGGWLQYCVDDSPAGPGGSGGAVHTNSCTVTITGCSFTMNYSGAGGGQCSEDDFDMPPEPRAGTGRNGLGAGGGSGGALCLVDTTSTMDGCDFDDNSARQGGESVTRQAGGGGHGGALYLLGGSGDASDCELVSNSAGGGGYGPEGLVGASGHGGAIFGSCVDVTLSHCTLRDNVGGWGWGDEPWSSLETAASLPDAAEGGSGGAVYAESGLLALTECLFKQNYGGMGGYSETASEWADDGDGGAVWCSNAGDDALDADSCAFVYNYGELGGAVHVAAGTARLVNCTFGEDYAEQGGGLYGADGASLRLSFCTVADNAAESYGGGIAAYSLDLRGCIVANNSFEVLDSPQPAEGTPADGPDIYDFACGITSHGGNVLGTTTGFSLSVIDPSPLDVTDVDPMLGPLTDAARWLYSFPLLLGSPAIDLVPTQYGETIDDEPVEEDELDTSRPLDGDDDSEALWDAGAFELPPQVFVVPSATGEGDITIRGGDAGVMSEVDSRGADDVCCEVPEGFSFPYGLVEFWIWGLPEEGEPAVVTVTLVYPDDIPEGAMYWKCDGDTCEWLDVTHLLGDDDGDNTLTLTLTDGGDGDMDEDHDGEIEDPGGVVLAIEEEEEPEEEEEERPPLWREHETPPEPASMGVSYLNIDPIQVLPNQEVVVSANICNSGDERGSRTVSLMVNGSAEQSLSVGVSGGSCQQVVFRLSRAVPGTYRVAIDGMTGQFSVLAPRTVQASVPSAQTGGIRTAGIIAIVAVMLVLIAALIMIFRKG